MLSSGCASTAWPLSLENAFLTLPWAGDCSSGQCEAVSAAAGAGHGSGWTEILGAPCWPGRFCDAVIQKRALGPCACCRKDFSLAAVWSWGCGAAAASHLLGNWIQHAVSSCTVPRLDLGLGISKNFVVPVEVAWAVSWSQPYFLS